MISSISSVEIINAVMPYPTIFFFIDASLTDTATVNANETKMLLANGMSAFFINSKPTKVNGLIKLRHAPSGIVIILVVPFYKASLFSKDLITFIISFTSLLVSIISETESPSLIFDR